MIPSFFPHKFRKIYKELNEFSGDSQLPNVFEQAYRWGNAKAKNELDKLIKTNGGTIREMKDLHLKCFLIILLIYKDVVRRCQEQVTKELKRRGLL